VDGIRVFSGTVGKQFRVGLVDLGGQTMIPNGVDEILRIETRGEGSLELSNTITIAEGGGKIPTSVRRARSESTLPRKLTLDQNVPNPFNPTTVISFSLPEAAHVTLDVYNIMGQRVATLLEERMAAGRHTVTWNGRTHDGRQATSGVYLYKIVAGSHTETRKMLLLK
jgi:hypothetical protein